MKTIPNYNNIDPNEGGSFGNLPEGGYVCVITKVTDKPDKEYLEIEYDIAEGDFAGWWSKTAERAGFWGGKLIRSYKVSAVGFFKGFITAVEQSNPGYVWNWNEQGLVGKAVGLVLGLEEYRKQDGSYKDRLYVARNTSVDKIRKREFTVPDYKPCKDKPASAGFAPEYNEFTDVDCPF